MAQLFRSNLNMKKSLEEAYAQYLFEFIKRGSWGNGWRYCFICKVEWVINKKSETLKCTTFGCHSLEFATERNQLEAVQATVFAAYDDLKIGGSNNG